MPCALLFGGRFGGYACLGGRVTGDWTGRVARTFYRVVQTDPPTLRDFASHAALGRPLIDPAYRRRWQGVSVFGTVHQARKKARQYPTLGRFIAELAIPDEAAVQSERTGSANHHTLWASPKVLLACVVAVTPVDTE